MKIIIPTRKGFLLILGLAAVVLISIGYAGIGRDITVETVETVETVNSQYRKPVDKQQQVSQSTQFFVEYRLERERTRGQQVEWLREIINNTNADTDTRKKAQEQLFNISQDIGKEMETENLIRAKGFNDAVVLLQPKAVTVVVHVEKLTTSEAAQIAELVSRNTGVEISHIVIIPNP